MKAAVVRENGRIELADIPPPAPGPYDCLVKIDACAACTGTDLNIIAGTFPWREELPIVLGHESTGLIVEVGERVRHFEPGQRVTRPAAVLPGQRRDGLGSNWGGFAELGLVRDMEAASADGVEGGGGGGLSRVPMPDDVDPISAALCVNQREILSVVARFTFGADSRVAVVGSGYNGLLFSFFAAHFGAGTVLMVGNERRSALATSAFGADAFADYRQDGAARSALDALGGEPTHVIDAVGSVSSMHLATDLLGPQTAFGCYGVHEYEATRPLVEQVGATHPSLDVTTDEPGATEAWYEMWRDGDFAREGMIGGLLPLESIALAFDLLARRRAVKLVLTM